MASTALLCPEFTSRAHSTAAWPEGWISRPQLEKEIFTSILHCKALQGQTTAVTSGAMVVLQLVKTKHLPTKIQVQRCSKCEHLLALNQLLTAHHLWSHKLVLIVPVYSTRIVELWSCSSLFCSLFSYGKGFPRTISLFPLNKREKVGWNYIYIASQLWCSRLTTANFIFKNLWVELHSTKEGSLF